MSGLSKLSVSECMEYLQKTVTEEYKENKPDSLLNVHTIPQRSVESLVAVETFTSSVIQEALWWFLVDSMNWMMRNRV